MRLSVVISIVVASVRCVEAFRASGLPRLSTFNAAAADATCLLGSVNSNVNSCPAADTLYTGWCSTCPSLRRRGQLSRRHTRTSLRMASGTGGNGADDISKGLRLLAVLPYLLPILDNLETGKYFFKALPELGMVVHTALAPLLGLWEHVPFLPIIIFILLSILGRRTTTDRFVRFNIQQAILVDLASIALDFIAQAAGQLTDEGLQMMDNFTFYLLIIAIVYSTFETARGRIANQIPYISFAAEMASGPR